MTGLLKSLAVVPLICSVLPTAADNPEMVKVAAKAVMSVPKGTVAAMAVPLISAVTVDVRASLASVKLNAVMSLVSFAAMVTITV